MEFRHPANGELFQFQPLILEVRSVSLSSLGMAFFALSRTTPGPHEASSLERVFFFTTGLTGSRCSAEALLVRVGRCEWGQKWLFLTKVRVRTPSPAPTGGDWGGCLVQHREACPGSGGHGPQQGSTALSRVAWNVPERPRAVE